MILPAFGSSAISSATFSKKPISANPHAYAMVLDGVIGFVVWAQSHVHGRHER